MSTPTPTARGPWQRFVNFWFAPGDPTTLGFIRIVTGLLVLYVHLAYSFDLTAFFGRDAWYGLESVNRERLETPYVYPPLGWDESEKERSATLPEFPHRKQAVVTYLRELGRTRPTRGELDPVLAYMDRLQATGDHLLARDGLEYVLRLSADPAFRKNQLQRLVDEKSAVNDPVPLPVFVSHLQLSSEERAKVADEIDRFYRTLPEQADGEARLYVLNYFAAMDVPTRKGVLDFLRELTKVDEAERKKRLDYLEYWGFEARRADRFGSPIFSLWFHVTDPTEMAVAHGVVLAIMVLFTVGLFTRVTSVLTWLAAISYIHRTQQVLFGMDTMMNILLLYLMIGNSGAALSVDRLINRYRAVRASLRRSGTVDAATQAYLRQPPNSASAAFALRLIQVHFCFIYFAAGVSKLKGPAWWNTNAYWDTLANPEFTMIHYHWYESLVRSLASNRFVYSVAAALGVGFTFFCELGVPFLVWTRLRWVAVIAGFFLHAGVAVFMGLWIFSLMMMTLLLAYLPGAAIRSRLFSDPETPERVRVRFKAASEDQAHEVAVMKAFDFHDTVDVAPAEVSTVEVESKAGKATGEDALRTLRQQTGTTAGAWRLLQAAFSAVMKRVG